MDLNALKGLTVIDTNGCWIWQRSCSSAGYGQITINGKYWSTHRLAYVLTNGPIPDGLLIRHSCHVPACCNPSHLLAGKDVDNWKDSEDKHRENNIKRSQSWIVLGVKYHSCRQACKKTGISMNSLIKYTVNGVFDITAYHEGCRIAGWEPKV